jgi:hypothetical protein
VIAAAFLVQWRRTVTKFKGATRGREVDATTVTAHLPGLDIEIVHRRLPDSDAEQI